MSLLVGYDASSTLAPRTGVGRAALGLLKALVALPEDGGESLRYRVLLNSLTKRPGPEHAFLTGAANAEVVRGMRPGPLLVEKWRKGQGPTVGELLGGGVKVFHAPASYIPPKGPERRVVTVHDLAFLHDPPGLREKLGGAWFAEVFPRELPQLAAIHTPSEATRRDVLRRYPDVPPDRVVAIPWGVDPEVFFPESERLAEVARHEAGIPSKHYLLAVASHQPRKRNGLLLDAYARLRAREPHTPPLAVLGWGGEPPVELKNRRDLFRVVFPLPHLADRFLAGLYSGASCLLFTSQDEGFGFPVLEAMACGCPVLCGRGGALAEVAGEAAARPAREGDPEAWSEAALPLIFDQDVREDLRGRGLQQAARFTWAGTARRMAELYRAVATWGVPV